MAEPFIFIGTHTIKEGKLEDFKLLSQEFCRFVEANEPRLVHFGFYLDEDGTEVTVVQVHPDADSMAFHMQVAGEHFVKAYEFLDTTKSLQVFGSADDALVAQMKQVTPPGVPVIVKSEHVAFDRLPTAAV